MTQFTVYHIQQIQTFIQDYTEVFVKKSVETKVLQLAQDIGMIISLL